jgi:hypothetical protein
LRTHQSLCLGIDWWWVGRGWCPLHLERLQAFKCRQAGCLDVVQRCIIRWNFCCYNSQFSSNLVLLWKLRF